MMLTCYPSPGKVKAGKICQYFNNGCLRNKVESQVVPAGHATLEPGAAFFYGWTDYTALMIGKCRSDGRDWYYADNAYYFGRGAYFRITKNALMHDGSLPTKRPGHRLRQGKERFEQFRIDIAPWRQDGKHVIVATQSDLFCRMKLGQSRREWTAGIVAELEAATDRTIIVCDKPNPKTMARSQAHSPRLEILLEDAWALVTHSSSAAVAALLKGVPVFSTAPSHETMVSRMGLSDLSMIEEPFTPDGREEWTWMLAANQWRYREMASGKCWADLQLD